MVYTKIDVYRGLIIPPSLLLEIYNSEISETKHDTLEDMKNNIYDVIFYLNEQFCSHSDKSSRINSLYEFRIISPCCSKNYDIILGISIKTYKRIRWDKEQCIKKLNEIQNEMNFTRNVIPKLPLLFNSLNILSKDCLGIVISYLPINNTTDEEFKGMKDYIIDHTLKLWKSRNVFCGKDLCGDHFVCDDCLGMTENGKYDVCKMSKEPVECKEELNVDKYANLTIESFIDDKLNQICYKIDGEFAFDYKSIEIKNYYCLDDCLSCS